MPAVKGRAVAEAVSHQPVTEDRVRYHAIPREFYGGQMAVGQAFLWVVFPLAVSMIILFFIYMWFLPKQTGEAYEPSKKQGPFKKSRSI
jgi:hypothetical protein